MTLPAATCDCDRARHKHGDLNMYVKHGCRCFPCRLTRSRYGQVYRSGGKWSAYDWRPAVGVARRLQALAAIGHTDRAVARRLGMQVAYVNRLRAGKFGKVTPATYEAVARLYDQLWDEPYGGPYSCRTKALAERKGWLPPLAWDDIDNDPEPASVTDLRAFDEIAVERYIAGTLRHRHAQNYPPELIEAVRRMHARGLSDRAVGERIGLSQDAVSQLRRRKLAGAA